MALLLGFPFLGSILLLSFHGFNESPVFVVASYLVYAINAAVVIALIRRRLMILACFNLFNILVPFTIFTFQYCLKIPFSNWRGNVIDSHSTYESAAHLNFQLLFVAAMGVFALWRDARREDEPPASTPRPIPNEVVVMVGIASLILIALLAFNVMGKTRDDFMMSSATEDRFILRFGIDSLGFLFALCLTARVRVMKLIALMQFIIAFLLAGLGFRSLMVQLIFIAAITAALFTKIKLRHFVAAMIGSTICYFGLLLFAYTRAESLRLGSTVNMIANRKITLEQILPFAGANEQCYFYTFHFERNRPQTRFPGSLYANSIIHLLPNFMHRQLTDAPSTGRIIAEECAPRIFLARGLTMGCYYPAEAYMNFGAIGPYLIIVAIHGFSAIMERLKSKGEACLVFYTVTASLMPVFVLYGLENFAKTLLLMSIASIALDFTLRYRRRAASKYRWNSTDPF